MQMDGSRFRTIRKAFQMSALEWGRALGYQTGNDTTVASYVRAMEAGTRPIPPAVARLAEMFRLHGVPEQFR